MPESNALYCLVYVSRIASAHRSRIRQVVREILTQAQHRNARNGVTGLLVFNSTFFVQALEGELEAVDRTFSQISRDVRHSFPTVVYKQPIAERSFHRWTMCARELSKLDNDILDRLEQRGAFVPTAESGASLLEQLRSIGRVHHAVFDQQMRDTLYL
jgi:hypothetical protein